MNNKPWDNEPSPTTDGRNHRNGIIAYQYARNLERRMRHAERLLEMDYMCPHCMYDSENISMKKLRIVHLEAARQEDCR